MVKFETSAGSIEFLEVIQGWSAAEQSCKLLWKGQLLQLKAVADQQPGSMQVEAFGAWVMCLQLQGSILVATMGILLSAIPCGISSNPAATRLPVSSIAVTILVQCRLIQNEPEQLAHSLLILAACNGVLVVRQEGTRQQTAGSSRASHNLLKCCPACMSTQVRIMQGAPLLSILCGQLYVGGLAPCAHLTYTNCLTQHHHCCQLKHPPPRTCQESAHYFGLMVTR